MRDEGLRLALSHLPHHSSSSLILILHPSSLSLRHSIENTKDFVDKVKPCVTSGHLLETFEISVLE